MQWVIQCTARHRQASSLILLLSVRILIPDWCTEHRVQYERRCLKTDPLRTGRRVLSFLLWRNKILVVWIDIVLFMCAAAFLVVGIVQLKRSKQAGQDALDNFYESQKCGQLYLSWSSFCDCCNLYQPITFSKADFIASSKVTLSDWPESPSS